MAVSDSNLRALIRYMPMARALKSEVDRIATLESYEDSGELVAGSFRRLLAGVTRLTDDPYLAGLGEDVEAAGTDKRRVTATQLGLSQLLAYLESETGVTASEYGGILNYQKNPVTIGTLRGGDPKVVAKILGHDREEEDEG
ncbi:MAG: hypothetical protein ACYC5O_22010 [Anaerolineae bacterium]